MKKMLLTNSIATLMWNFLSIIQKIRWGIYALFNAQKKRMMSSHFCKYEKMNFASVVAAAVVGVLLSMLITNDLVFNVDTIILLCVNIYIGIYATYLVEKTSLIISEFKVTKNKADLYGKTAIDFYSIVAFSFLFIALFRFIKPLSYYYDNIDIGMFALNCFYYLTLIVFAILMYVTYYKPTKNKKNGKS